ncbi:hypothetical protein ALC62_01183 [Cyphomyrmex costatus]|uniref:Uncharacterized protein n=1 Tax=Cyphomyrmex costatus TaxID=456900 RepID=A0A151IPG4_9HYME|nr:hypothetical protein ALC62_01183 [Cyphomyrmex costatus]
MYGEPRPGLAAYAIRLSPPRGEEVCLACHHTSMVQAPVHEMGYRNEWYSVYSLAKLRCSAPTDAAQRGPQSLHPGTEPEIKWNCGEIERRNLVFIRYLHAELRILSLFPFLSSRRHLAFLSCHSATAARRIPIQNRIYRMFLGRQNTKYEIKTDTMKKMYRWQTRISVL